MGLFKKKKETAAEEKPVRADSELMDSVSKAYDDIMEAAHKRSETPPDDMPADTPVTPPAPQQADASSELLKARIREFTQKKTPEALTEVIKMLPRRQFSVPSVCNIKDPLEKKPDGTVGLKKGAVITPALLQSQDKKTFLPIFTDEASMTQKSPSGIVLRYSMEQCVDMVYNPKTPVKGIVINPFTENMMLGEELLRTIFIKKKNI